MSGVLVYLESITVEDEEPARSLVAKGREIAEQVGGSTAVIVLGRDLKNVPKLLGKMGVDEVFLAEADSLENYNPEMHGRIVSDLADRVRPAVLLLGHTYNGMDLGGVLAFRLRVPYLGNCTDISARGGEVVAFKPYYRSKAVAEIIASKFAPCLVGLETGFRAPARQMEARDPVVCMLPQPTEVGALRQRVLEVRGTHSSGPDITKSEKIVSVGRGIGERANIEVARALADALGGTLACSKPLVDMGWFPVSAQVGLSGKSVAPKLYIACGISGAIEHKVGMKGSGLVVAINRDAQAPIFDVADFGIVGEVSEVVPLLTKAVLERRSSEAP